MSLDTIDVEIIEDVQKATFYYFNETPHLKVGQDSFELNPEAFDALMESLKIPKKFMQRFLDESHEEASNTINFWMNRCHEISGVCDGAGNIYHIFDASQTYLPIESMERSLRIYLGLDSVYSYYDDGVYIGTFPTSYDSIQLANGEEAFLSVRLMLSDCMKISPRVDGVLTVKGCYDNFYLPIQGRKFRTSGYNIAQIDAMIREFTDIVSEQMLKLFVPRLNSFLETEPLLPVAGFLGRLCTDIRLTKRVGGYLLSEVGDGEKPYLDIVRGVTAAVMPEVRPQMIDRDEAREIEIALGRSILKGSFR